MVPADAVAERATVPVPQRLAGVDAVIVGMALIVAEIDVREPVIQPALVASAKQLVVDEIEGVVKEVPVPSDAPPVAAAYQLIVPADAVAERVTVPVPQFEPGVEAVMVGIALIVAVIEVLEPVVQPALVASTK